MGRRVRLQDVADLVGVSKSTVSEVLRRRVGKVTVGEATRRRILEAVRDLDYEPTAAAQSLVTGRTYQIGYLVSAKTTLGLANTYFATLMSGVQGACQRRGYRCVVSAYDLSSVKDFVVPSDVRSRCVDGIFITGTVEEEVLDVLLKYRMPFMITGRHPDFAPGQALSVGYLRQARSLLPVLEHLYGLGHRRIGLGGIPHSRLMELEEMIAEHGGPVKEAVKIKPFPMDWTQDQFEEGRSVGATWLSRPARPTAVMGSDQWCVGFLSGLIDAGGRCPGDVSVACGSDTPLCEWGRPAITAYRIALFDETRAATDALIDFVEGKLSWREARDRAASLWQGGELMVRGSTGAIA